MELDEQLKLAHLLLEERICRVCKEQKNLLNGFYRTRKNMNLLSSYSYECKDCTIQRVKTSRKTDIGDWTYPDWWGRINLLFQKVMAVLSWLGLGAVIGIIGTVVLMKWYNPHWYVWYRIHCRKGKDCFQYW